MTAASINWQALSRAFVHPLRVSILEVLALDGGRRLSPTELHHELQMPISNVNYHVEELAKAGLLKLVAEQPVRGATEHFYALAASRKSEQGGERS
jgi:DNA-binding IclR family transcriptional regulator